MKINSIMLAGAGAVGLSTAEAVYDYDPDCISVLATGERLARYRKNGLRINGKKIDFRLTEGEKTDLIIIACKFHHLNQVIKDIKSSVGKDTLIISLLNGISSEEIIGKELGRERLPLAMILGTDALHGGEETAYTRRGTVHFGDGQKNGEREERIAEFFSRSGVKYRLETDMKRVLWFKFMLNTGVNQVTAVLRLPYGCIMNKGGPAEIPEARELIERAMRETVTIANEEGIDLNENDIMAWYDTVNVLNPASYTSMCQDVLAKRKTEVEMFSLTLMELGKKHGIKLPVNETLYLQIKTIEKSYGG